MPQQERHFPHPEFIHKATTKSSSMSSTTSPPQNYAYYAPQQPYAAHAMDDPTLLHNLRCQIEFYFSPENLSRDTFLQQQLNSPEHLGCVPVHVICQFPKMKQIFSTHQLGYPIHHVLAQPADPHVVIHALRSSQAVQVTPDGQWMYPVVHQEQSWEGTNAMPIQNKQGSSFTSPTVSPTSFDTGETMPQETIHQQDKHYTQKPHAMTPVTVHSTPPQRVEEATPVVVAVEEPSRPYPMHSSPPLMAMATPTATMPPMDHGYHPQDTTHQQHHQHHVSIVSSTTTTTTSTPTGQPSQGLFVAPIWNHASQPYGVVVGIGSPPPQRSTAAGAAVDGYYAVPDHQAIAAYSAATPALADQDYHPHHLGEYSPYYPSDAEPSFHDSFHSTGGIVMAPVSQIYIPNEQPTPSITMDDSTGSFRTQHPPVMTPIPAPSHPPIKKTGHQKKLGPPSSKETRQAQKDRRSSEVSNGTSNRSAGGSSRGSSNSSHSRYKGRGKNNKLKGRGGRGGRNGGGSGKAGEFPTKHKKRQWKNKKTAPSAPLYEEHFPALSPTKAGDNVATSPKQEEPERAPYVAALLKTDSTPTHANAKQGGSRDGNGKGGDVSPWTADGSLDQVQHALQGVTLSADDEDAW